MNGRGGPTRATTLRELTNLGFMYRERARFRAGTSALLGLTLDPLPGDGIVVDVTGVAELAAVSRGADGSASLGAFAPLDAIPAAAPELAGRSGADLSLRLALRDPKVVVYGRGAQRTAGMEGLELAPYEVPVTILLSPLPTGLAIAERRITVNDATAPFALGVTVALRVTPLLRIAGVRVLVEVDGETRRIPAAETLLEGKGANRDPLPEAARHVAAAFPTTNARGSAIARNAHVLALAALREALDAARRPQG